MESSLLSNIYLHVLDLLWSRHSAHLGTLVRYADDRDYLVSLGLHRLRGTVQYPEATQYRWHESPPASRVREIRTHGFYGGRTETRKEGK
jgi:hypothetical protein